MENTLLNESWFMAVDPEQIGNGKTSESWERTVWVRCKNRCGNCKGDDRLRVNLIVPLSAGGREIESNAVLLCRACEMASEAIHSNPSERRPVNFWVGTEFYNRIKNFNGFSSMGALVRYLVDKYVSDADRFDDLEQYQETGSDIKINVWLDVARYNEFKELITARGISVTDAIKSLILVYEMTSESRLVIHE